jgi:hypothetical protein
MCEEPHERHHTSQHGSLFVFPAIAIWAARTGGPSRLWLALVIALIIVVVFALASGAAWFGNRLASTYGYGYTGPRALFLFGLTMGLPITTATLTIRKLMGARQPRLQYVASLLVVTLTWIVSVLLAAWILQ